MLLTLDVGNTNTVLGVFRGKELVANWRLTTARDQTIDEYGILTRDLFTLGGSGAARNRRRDYQFGGAAAESRLAGMAERYFEREGAFCGAGDQDGHAGAVRQSAGSGRGPHREQRGGV